MQSVNYTFFDKDDDFDVEALIGGQRVGSAQGLRDGDRVHLADIRIDDPPRRRVGLIASLFGAKAPRPLRRQGIGTELLKRFLGEADARGVREIWGEVTKHDASDWLLNWYRKHGFVVEDPDKNCMENTAKKVVRRR